MYDFIFDFETLSQDALSGVVVDCSAFHFDWERFTSDNPYTLDDAKDAKKFKVSVADQVKKYGYAISKDTLKWWEGQSEAARKNISPSKNDLTLQEFSDAFLNYASSKGKIGRWWSRSNTFDPIFIQRIAGDTGNEKKFSNVLKYNAVRDTRTYIDAKLNFPKINGFCPLRDENKWAESFVAHDSRYDILADVMRMQLIVRAENDMEPYVDAL